MNNCNRCCNQHRNSCSCRGERIRVGTCNSSCRSNRCNRSYENTCRPRLCESKSCARLRAEERCYNHFNYCMKKARNIDNCCGCKRGCRYFKEGNYTFSNDGSCRNYCRSCGCNNFTTFHNFERCSDEFGCNDDECDDFDFIDQGLYNASLGMAYVPRQRWKCVFRCEEGFYKGTIFSELYKPFCSKGGK